MRLTIPALAMALLLGTPGCTARERVAEPPVPQDRAAMMALIVREARAIGVEPALALAVAHVESNFDPTAESPVGARGLMQVMPATVRGEYALHEDVLWDARLNARVGLHFLRRLLDYYDDEEQFALSWYNGGSRVGPPERARVLPATRPYVDKVLRLKQVYAQRLREAPLVAQN